MPGKRGGEMALHETTTWAHHCDIDRLERVGLLEQRRYDGSDDRSAARVLGGEETWGERRMRDEASVVIDRPIEEVFAFSTDQEKIALWAGPVTEAKQTSEGPLGVGTTSTRVIHFVGRRIESNYEVTQYQPNSRFSAKTTSGPIPIVEAYTFEAGEGGTKVTVAMEGDPAGFFKLAKPIFARILKRQMENDVRTLKDLLEAQA